MRKFLVRYHASRVDYEATVQKALEQGTKVELGGGRKTKSGESPNSQILFNLKDINSTIELSRTGKINVYYTSRPNLEKCFQVLSQCYVPSDEIPNLRCEGPVDPLDRAFEFKTIVNWMGTNITYAEARTRMYQWLDSKTGEYLFRLPDKENRVTWPGSDYIFEACLPIVISAIDKDDEMGNRVVTAERLVWKGVQELKRIAREHPRVRFECGADGKWRCY